MKAAIKTRAGGEENDFLSHVCENISTKQQTICAADGEEIMQKHWDTTHKYPESCLMFQAHDAEKASEIAVL